MFSIFKKIPIFLLFIFFQDKSYQMEIENTAQESNTIKKDRIKWKHESSLNFYKRNNDLINKARMPYINYNRTIFLDTFLIDSVLSDNGLNKFIIKLESIIIRTTSAIDCLNSLINLDDTDNITQGNAEKYIFEFLKSPIISSKEKNLLNNELIKIKDNLKYRIMILNYRKNFYNFIDKLDNYVFEDFTSGLFHHQIRPFFILNHCFSNNNSLDDKKHLSDEIISQYKVIKITLNNYKSHFSTLKNFNLPIHILTPLILKDNILFRWGVECTIRNIIAKSTSSNKSNEPSRALLYSINTCSIIKHILQFLDIIVNLPTNEIIDDGEIKTVKITNEIFHASVFESYELKIFGKIYLARKFKLIDNPSLPSGMLTAYLNVNNNFQSLGILAVQNIDDISNPFFISVEEVSDFFITTNNFGVLINDERQIFHFIYDFLNVLNSLHHIKIKLMSNNIVVAVNKSNNKRWRFRVDDIGEFFYCKHKTGFENNEVFVGVLSRAILLVRDEKLLEFFRQLRSLAEVLCSTKELKYITTLQIKVNKFKSKMVDYLQY